MAAAVAGGLLAGGGAAGLLEGFEIKLATSGFGRAMSDIQRFNKGWESMNKKLAPATNLWNKVQGVMGKTLGVLKGMLAPLAIGGGLFAAFFLAGQAGREVFGVFGQLIGAFSDVLVGALMPAIKPIIEAVADLIPMWQEIFGSPEWTATMKQLGEALGTLVSEGLSFFIELIGAAVAIMPFILPALADMATLFAQIFQEIRQTGYFQALVQATTIFVGIIGQLITAGFLIWLKGILIPWLALAPLMTEALQALIPFGKETLKLIDSGLFGWITDVNDSIIDLIDAGFLGWITDLISSGFDTWMEDLAPIVKKLADGMTDVSTALGITGGMMSIWGRAFVGTFNTVIGGINAVVSAYNAIPLVPDLPLIPLMPSLQYGGIVERTGLAIVHEGEHYSGVGTGASGFGGLTINGPLIETVNLGGATQEDASHLADIVSEELRKRMITGISTAR